MPKLLPWPDLTGARDCDGDIVVQRRKSRSKHCATRLLLTNIEHQTYYERLAIDVPWGKDRNTIAILANGLQDLVNSKVEVPFDRGLPAIQVIDTYLVMYEAGPRGTLWPRYWWSLHLSCPGFSWAIAEAIRMETLRPDVLVAFPDKRAPAVVNPHLPDTNFRHPHWTGNLKEWVDAVILRREWDG